MDTKEHPTNKLFYEFMSHLAKENIDYAGSDVDRIVAIQKLEKEGWVGTLEYIIACCDEILSKHTAFSWHYEPDEGLEEARVHPERDRAQFALDLGKKLQKVEPLDLYSDAVLELLENGLGVCSRGFFGSNYYIDDVANWGLDFLLANVPNEEIKQKIEGFRDPTQHRGRVHYPNGRERVLVHSDMNAEQYISTYFPIEK